MNPKKIFFLKIVGKKLEREDTKAYQKEILSLTILQILNLTQRSYDMYILSSSMIKAMLLQGFRKKRQEIGEPVTW